MNIILNIKKNDWNIYEESVITQSFINATLKMYQNPNIHYPYVMPMNLFYVATNHPYIFSMTHYLFLISFNFTPYH